MTLEELKEVIEEVIDRRMSQWLSTVNGSYYLLPPRTKEEQMQKNKVLLKWYRKWAEEGDAEEQRETLEYLQKALDEDRLSNRPLFPAKT